MRITLRAARVNAGLTSEEAAKRFGVHYNTLLDFELGKRTISWKVASKVEEVYGIPLENIILPERLTEREVNNETVNS